MKKLDVTRIKSHPKFVQMAQKKSRLSLIFSLLTLFMYMAYILTIGFNKALFAKPIGTGVITWGIVFGVLVILFCIIITAIYVQKANRFDVFTHQVMDEIHDHI